MFMYLVSIEGSEAAWLDSLSERKGKHMHGTPSEEKNKEEMDTVTGSGTWEALL